MKRNTFMKRLAVTALAATMTFGTVPMTAVTALAKTEVTTDTDGLSDSDKAMYDGIEDAIQEVAKDGSTTDIRSANNADRYPNGKDDNDGNIVFQNFIADVNKQLSEYKLDDDDFELTPVSGSDGEVSLDQDGNVKAPVLQGTADIQKSDGTGYKEVSFTVDANRLSAKQKVQAVKLIISWLNTHPDDVKALNDNKDLTNDDNRSSVLSIVKKAINKYGNGLVTSDDTDLDLTIKSGSYTKTNATKDATGSLAATVHVKVADGYKDASGDSASNKYYEEDDQAVTLQIAKTSASSEDNDYQAKLAAALQAEDFVNSDFEEDNGTKELTESGKKKIQEALENADLDKDFVSSLTKAIQDKKVSARNIKLADHKGDGSANILFESLRSGEGETYQAQPVKITISHAKDIKEVSEEASDAVANAVSDLQDDSTSIQAANSAKAADKDDAKTGIENAIRDRLADTLKGTNTIASEIDSFEVKDLTDSQFTKSTTSQKGSIKGLTVVVTYKTYKEANVAKAALGDDADDFDGLTAYTKDSENVPTDLDLDANQVAYVFDLTGENGKGETIELAKLNKVTATGFSLKDTYYVVKGTNDDHETTYTGKISPDFTPEDANDYTIKYVFEGTNKDKFKIGDTKADNNSYTVEGDDAKVTPADAETGLNVGDTVTVRAYLLNDDNLTVATATTTVKVIKGFEDVQDRSAYYYNAVTDLYRYGYVAGTSDDPLLYSPSKQLTRAEFVQMLYNVAKEVYEDDKDVEDPADVKVTDKFSDVKDSAWYAKAVSWAVERGVTAGKTATTFDPSGKVTRAEAVQFLYNLLDKGQTYNSVITTGFEDVNSNAWYAQAVAWAVRKGVTSGKTATKFAPSDITNRAQAAVFVDKVVDDIYYVVNK